MIMGAPGLVVGVFRRAGAVLTFARTVLCAGTPFPVVHAGGGLASHALRGAGDTRWPFRVQAGLAWALRLPAVWAFAIWLEGGVFGAWVGELVYVLGITLALLWRFRTGSWRTMRI